MPLVSGFWTGARSLRRDGSVTQQKIAPGTVKRIARFTAAYRWILAAYLALITVDAVLGVANPLILRKLINDGIIGQNEALVIGLALLVAALAVVGAGLSSSNATVSSCRRGARLRDAFQGVRAHPAHAARLLHPHTDRCAGQPAEQRRDWARRRPSPTCSRRWSAI